MVNLLHCLKNKYLVINRMYLIVVTQAQVLCLICTPEAQASRAEGGHIRHTTSDCVTTITYVTLHDQSLVVIVYIYCGSLVLIVSFRYDVSVMILLKINILSKIITETSYP